MIFLQINIDSYGGAVWSLAVNQEQTLLAVNYILFYLCIVPNHTIAYFNTPFVLDQAGCEDGCVRLFDISMDDIQYARVFIKQEGLFVTISTI